MKGTNSRKVQNVNRPRAIASNALVPRLEILQRATRRVEFHRTIIVRCE